MFNDKRLTLMIPAHEIEQGAKSQIAQVLGVDVMEKMVILPDVHQGYDIPIGSAVMLDNHIWPGAVGLDINCGMCNVNTRATLEDLKLSSLFDRENFLLNLIDAVPTGYHCFETPKESFLKFPNNFGTKEVFNSVMEKANKQLGTLGGGKMIASSPRE